MKRRGEQRATTNVVSASQLARLTYCERLVLFEHTHGPRSTSTQRALQAKGMRAHQHFEQDGRISRAVGRTRSAWVWRFVIWLWRAVGRLFRLRPARSSP
jgi:hypothetical protein